jgi:Predicted membrane protein (DUF2207)
MEKEYRNIMAMVNSCTKRSFWYLVVFILSTVTHTIWSVDYIAHFDSVIKVEKSGTLDITETIDYVSDIRKHGIFREYPTMYKDRAGNTIVVGFTVNQILMDGKPIDYVIENAYNGKIIKIGNPAGFITPGKHVYTINYHTTRQIGFFKDHDELYFNITGNGWSVSIESAKANVILPDLIPSNAIEVEGYTGRLGQKEKDFRAIVTGHEVHLETIRTLQPNEGVTVVVSWPKGFVTEPTMVIKIFWFLKDNLTVLWIFLMTVIVLIYYGFTYLAIRRKSQAGVIIPLFEPPLGFSPGRIRFIAQMGYDSVAFAAEIVELAVKGLLTIDYEKKFFNSSYILKKQQTIENSTIQNLNKEQKAIFDTLLSSRISLELGTKNNTIIQDAVTQQKTILESELSYNYLDFNSEKLGVGLLISGCALVPILPFLRFSGGELFCLALLGCINLIFFYLSKTYTTAGRKIMDQIQGFKMFLETTEIERMKVVGTPPTKTPELYEKYLPYAIALGVEEAWTKQFAPIFKRLEVQGHSYKPGWYTSNVAFNILTFNPSLLRNTLSNAALQSSARIISAASNAPGTYSGRGGKGSSGGGGGGGGGGSW